MQLMIRPLSLSLAAIALSATALCRAGETFPEVHSDPITVRIVSGKNGQPLSNLHLTLVGGYDRSDFHEQLYREEVLTDLFGKVRLSNQLANLPWLQVWVKSMPLCQSNPRKDSFSVELIRRDGLSAPNLCGPVTAQDAPGVFTVFVKNRAKNLKKGASIEVGMPVAPASTPAPVVVSAVQASAPIVPHTVTPEAVPAAAAPAQTQAEVAPKAEPIAPAPLPIFPAVSRSPIIRTKYGVHHQAMRVAAKRTARRARLVPVACSVQPPAARTKPKPAAKPNSKSTPPAKEESQKQEQNAPISASNRSKPLAGHRMTVDTPAHPTAAKKQE